jgi:beta-1,4-mannosyl-glycoprotein beta-1,4-N-acetylglucosaminyltransferase
MKIYDCFTFFNEIELLEMRLDYLYHIVDKFIISESNLTHSGREKQYNFKREYKRFKRFSDKLVYLEYDRDPTRTLGVKPEKYDPNHWCWSLERGQRDFLSTALFELDSDGIAVITDLDEIWNRDRSAELVSVTNANNLIRLGMSLHYFYFNYLGTGHLNKSWQHGFSIKNSLLKENRHLSLSYIREGRVKAPVLPGMGWHFSYLGGKERITEKLESFAHQELNKADFKSDSNIEKALKDGVDIFHRAGHQLEMCNLGFFPEGLAVLMKRVPEFIKT